jgi:RsiW-degrading membrane proteinase PrsW (M82 family)
MGTALLPIAGFWVSRWLPAKPKPRWVYWTAWLAGMVSVFPVLLVLLFEPTIKNTFSSPYLRSLADQFLLAALPEELLRFLIVLAYCAWRRAFTVAADGVVIGIAAAIGFATVETAMNCFSLWAQPDRDLSKTIGFLIASVSHANTGVIMGYYVGLARLRPHLRGRVLAVALVAPIILHTLYDFGVFADVADQPTSDDIDALPSWPTIFPTLLWMVVLAVELVWSICILRRVYRDARAV